MKLPLAIALTLVMSQFALAHELDEVKAVPSPEQKELPAHTIVIKTFDNDSTKVEIAQVKGNIPAGKKVAKLKYQQIALNGEVKNQDVNASNELDVTSSTSSWGFAVGYGGGAGYLGYRTPYWGGAYYGGYSGGLGYYQPTYYNSYASYYTAPYYANSYCGGYNGCGYQPYYGYSDNGCNYTYYQTTSAYYGDNYYNGGGGYYGGDVGYYGGGAGYYGGGGVVAGGVRGGFVARGPNGGVIAGGGRAGFIRGRR